MINRIRLIDKDKSDILEYINYLASIRTSIQIPNNICKIYGRRDLHFSSDEINSGDYITLASIVNSIKEKTAEIVSKQIYKDLRYKIEKIEKIQSTKIYKFCIFVCKLFGGDK